MGKSLLTTYIGKVLLFAVVVAVCYLGIVSFQGSWDYWTIGGAVYYGCLILVLLYLFLRHRYTIVVK